MQAQHLQTLFYLFWVVTQSLYLNLALLFLVLGSLKLFGFVLCLEVVSAVFIWFAFRQRVTPAAALRSRIGGQRQRLKSLFILAHVLNLDSTAARSPSQSPQMTYTFREVTLRRLLFISWAHLFLYLSLFFFCFLSSESGVFMGCWTSSFRENLKSLFQLCCRKQRSDVSSSGEPVTAPFSQHTLFVLAPSKGSVVMVAVQSLHSK